jgi:cytochrome c peroxidase
MRLQFLFFKVAVVTLGLWGYSQFELGKEAVFLNPNQMAEAPPSISLETVTKIFHTDLSAFAASLDRYVTIARTEDIDQIRQTHAEARLAFKRAEYLLEYIDPTAIKKKINGAPLPKTEPKVPEIIIVEPAGLQRLDELVWEVAPDFAAIQKMTEKLRADYEVVWRYAEGRVLQHHHVFNAVRLELIRLFTLGVSGFDTPASGTAIPEGIATLKSLKKTCEAYEPEISTRSPELYQKLQTSFQRALDHLAKADFESLDRLAFLTESINPLTEQVMAVTGLLDLELPTSSRNPLNYRASKLFDADWLNESVYAGLPPSDYETERTALGRLLFFDPILSSNNQLACASCHQPSRAFTDGQRRSLALDGKKTVLRNSPTLVNAVYAEKFFYDLREERLDRQIKHVVHDQLEFATNFVEITGKISQSNEYLALFNAAYPEYPEYALSRYSISDALARYVKSLRGLNSSFDQMARGELAADPEIAAGFNLFMGKAACGTCHFAPTFSGLVPPYYRESETEVLGVPDRVVWENASIDPDPGRIRSGRPEDEAYFHLHAFKTPTVRNVALTAPYMHNGVYDNLADVMDFYNRGGGAGIGSYVAHQTLPPDALELTEKEITSMIVFMEALTDTSGLTAIPTQLPVFPLASGLHQRKIGGEY